ncbi:PfkB family carbohydrate kinase [uncultured Thermanaerothrix sp.]|uniref:PfkB family carbohydrate kinase n=1 Tax=uncultured Thermanaerothrix sp. TaxID=1195149 RepID=UPI00261FFAE2|nr:PfkB family carbohydrate kinase [uncultured Thermanaerothrix sp.]
MRYSLFVQPVDYLVIGHVTQDLSPGGPVLGGTAAYAALTARAMGLRVGVITACHPETDLSPLSEVQVLAWPAEHTTTFENLSRPEGRVQYLHRLATSLQLNMVPEAWRKTPIVHLAPVAQEVDPKLVRAFPDSFIGLTPQGWLRAWDAQGRVHFTEWPEARYVLEAANAAVLSLEDVAGNEAIIEEMLASIRVLVVTEGAAGARLYWNGDLRYFRPPAVQEVDATGAGDVFAAAFFIRLHQTRDPWEAARYATQLAAISVTRPGLAGVPTAAEAQEKLVEIIP